MRCNLLTNRTLAFALVTSLAIGFTACSKDEEEAPPAEALITSFAITNAGQSQDVTVEGVISGTQIAVAVPFESDLTALTTSIEVSQGATVTPGSGSPLDFTEARNFVVSNGDAQTTYAVTVAKAEPDAAVLREIGFSSSATGEEYETQLDLINQTIDVTFNNLQSAMAKITTLEYGPNGAVASVALEDEIDLSAEGNTITISFAGEDKVYTINSEITLAGFDPEKTTTLIDKSSASGLVPTELNDNNSRGADFNGQYVFSPSRTDGNHVYYYDINASVFEAKELSMTGVSGGTWVVSDVKTVGDAIYVSNMVMAGVGLTFKVYRWDNVEDTEAEVILEYTTTADNQRLGDALSIVGDPATNGYIMASNFPGFGGNASANEIFVWKYTNGVAEEAATWTIPLTNDARIGQYGRVNGIPGDENHFLVSGAESLFVIDTEGNVVHEVNGETVQGRAMDAEIFEYNGGRYLSYTVNREWESNGAFSEIVNITEGASALEGIQALTPENIASKQVYKKFLTGPVDGWVNANHAVVFDGDTPMIFSFSTLGGFMVETLSR